MEEINQISGFNEKLVVQKFIQVYVKEKPYLKFFNNSIYHYFALEEFLDNLKINYVKIEKHGDLIPFPEGENYKLVGAGQTQTLSGECILHGESTSYNIKTNKKHLEDLFVQKQIKSLKEDKFGNNIVFFVEFK